MKKYTTENIVIVQIPSTRRFLDLTGQVFERLTVIGFGGSDGKHRYWWCRCSCGNITRPSSCNLRTQATKSCGCYISDMIGHRARRHGMSETRTHRSWLSLHERCRNPNDHAYSSYGGRGITVCERWKVFENFLEDMGVCPDGHQIDRIDNNKGYSRENCRWATRKQQCRNRRSSRTLTINGKQINAAAAAEMSGVQYKTFMARLYSGWSDHEAVFGRAK